MKLYIYQGLDKEKVPEDVTRVIVDDSVKIIKFKSFYECEHLVSIIMGDNVKRIEASAFYNCNSLRFVQLSKTLEFIGYQAFNGCYSLVALFLPSTVKSIEAYAFGHWQSFSLLFLPHAINLNNVNVEIIRNTEIYFIFKTKRYAYDSVQYQRKYLTHDGSHLRVLNEWLLHYIDELPFHKLCYDSFVTTKQINDYLNENGNDAVVVVDRIHDMTPLHMLSMNPHAPADTLSALVDVNVESAFRLDNQGKMSLDYARDHNVGGFVAMINGLCNHRHGARENIEEKEN